MGTVNIFVYVNVNKTWPLIRRVWRYQTGNQNRKSKRNRQRNGKKKKDKLSTKSLHIHLN